MPFVASVFTCIVAVAFIGSLRPLAPSERGGASNMSYTPLPTTAIPPVMPTAIRLALEIAEITVTPSFTPTATFVAPTGTETGAALRATPTATAAPTGSTPTLGASPTRRMEDTATLESTAESTNLEKTETSFPAIQTYDAISTRAVETPAPPTQAPTRRVIDTTTNILLIGTDQRPNDPAWQPNTDVLMMVFADTANHRVALLSFPRDLVVAIPRNQAGRINQVYYDGLSKKGQVEGADLLKEVMRDEYGIRVDHWALIDFDGLQKIIDTLGGIRVEVTCPLEDTIDGQHFVIPAGMVDMDYLTAKRYVQSRYSTSDTSRNYRQQRVLWAMAKKALDLNALDRLPLLYDQVKQVVQTDMSLFDMLSLVPAVYQLDLSQHPERLHAEVLQPPALYQWTSPDGAWLYLPNYDEIQKTLEHLFDAPVIAPSQAAPGECPPGPANEPTERSTVTPTPTVTATP